MTEYLKATKEVVERHRGACNFGVVDPKKREIGYTFRVFEVTFIHDPDGTWSLKQGTTLHYFEVWSHVTRDGKTYGSSSRNGECPTLERALELVERRMQACKKREVTRAARYSPVPAMED